MITNEDVFLPLVDELARKLWGEPRVLVNSITESELINAGREALKTALKNYDPQKVIFPRDLETFVAHWVYAEISKYIAIKSLQKVSGPRAAYFMILPPGKMIKLETDILSGDLTARKEKYSANKKTFNSLRPIFREIIIADNESAKKNFGKKNYIELSKEIFGVPEESLRFFIENVDQLIAILNEEINKVTVPASDYWSRYFLPCFICKNNNVNFHLPNDVLHLMERKYPELKIAEGKIEFIYQKDDSIEPSSTSYDKERDCFVIKMNHTPEKHMIISLIHELGHVVSHIRHFSRGENPLELSKYQAEKETVIITLETLKIISENFWRSHLVQILIGFWSTLFALSVYENPKQNFDILFAKTFNRCFLAGKQKENALYLVRWGIIRGMLHPLPYAVAETEALLASMTKPENKEK